MATNVAAASVSRIYGVASVVVAALLLWFAIWTATVSPLVLIGVRYAVVPWLLASTTMLTALAAILFGRSALARYADVDLSPSSPAAARRRAWPPIAAVAAGMLLILIAHRLSSVGLLLVAITLIAVGCHRLAPRLAPLPPLASGRSLAIGIGIVLAVCAALYFFGSRPDWDDANYINLATGAQRTAGTVFSLDTMVGDGPHPIHLPTYKLQTFELLGAALSSVTGLAPIVALHLLMPVPQLVLIALTFALLLVPLAGRDWIAAALFAIGLAYVNTDTYGTWGIHGIPRLFEGKGALVTAVIPLVCGLTGRYILHRRPIDLAGLGICHVCAVGLSANGVYLTPAASGFVALAFVAADPRAHWRAAAMLIPTLIYPAAMALVIAVGHLSLPSEVIGATDPNQQLLFVLGYHLTGVLLLVLLALAGLTASGAAARRAAAIYVPLALSIVLNPVGWTLASLATGNLGFRIIWAIPGPMIGGLLLARLGRWLTAGRGAGTSLLAAASIVIGIAVNRATPADFRIAWGIPGLKVAHAQYEAARQLAALAPPGCDLLAPEDVAVWAAGMPGSPHLAVVRRLYLAHYRFTEPAPELAIRWQLLGLMDGTPSSAPLPSKALLARNHIELGMIAADPGNPALARIGRFASGLGLSGPARTLAGTWYWRGACGARN